MSTIIKSGTKANFVDYEGNAEGELNTGDSLEITGYDKSQDTYNVTLLDKDGTPVEDEDGEFVTDSLYLEEFEVPEVEEKEEPKAKKTSAKKAKKKKTKKAKEAVEAVEEVEEVEPEPEAAEVAEIVEPSKTKTKKTKKKATKKKVQRIKEPKEEVEAELPKFVQTTSVKNALKEHGDALVAAEQLTEAKERATFTLGGVLAKIKRTNSFAALEDEEEKQMYTADLKGFDSYVADELGLAARTANYYVQLYEKFSQITTESKINKIGWTKLRQLLPLNLDKDNVDDWLTKAKEQSTTELKASVKSEMVENGESGHGNTDLSERKRFTFTMFDDQSNVMEEALDKAKEQIGEDKSDNDAMAHIVSTFLNEL